MTKTIAVKIGVVVGSDGTWIASGNESDRPGFDWMERIVRGVAHASDRSVSCHFVTAEIPIPDPVPTIPEIQGKAEKVDG